MLKAFASFDVSHFSVIRPSVRHFLFPLRRWSLSCLIGAWLAAFGCSVQAQDGGIRFDIHEFEVMGNTLLQPEQVDAILGPYKGPGRDFGTVQQALEALEKSYADLGYSAIQVILPEQTLEHGRVRYLVVESRLGAVRVEGNRHFEADNYRRSLVALQPGTTPNFDALTDNLRLLNDNPTKQATVVMRAGASEGVVDAVVKATDQNPLRFALTYDNSGTLQTGMFRMGFAVQYANLWDRDHVISFQAITSPAMVRRVRIYGLGYQIPMYDWNGMLGFFLGYSSVDSGVVSTAGGAFSIAGSGNIVGMRYTQYLPKRGDWDHRLSVGIDWKAYQNNVRTLGGAVTLVPDATVSPLTVAWQFSRRSSDDDLSGYFSVLQNLPSLFGGNDAHDSQIQRIGLRPGANSEFQIWRYGLNWQKALTGDWLFRAALSGQHARQKLLTTEMFGIGGADSVRGFLEREHANDFGHRASVELYTPDFGGKLLNGLKMRLLGFYDLGRVDRIEPTPQEAYATSISSAGIGVRANLGNSLSLRLDAAQVIDGSPTSRGMRLHGALSYVF